MQRLLSRQIADYERHWIAIKGKISTQKKSRKVIHGTF